MEIGTCNGEKNLEAQVQYGIRQFGQVELFFKNFVIWPIFSRIKHLGQVPNRFTFRIVSYWSF